MWFIKRFGGCDVLFMYLPINYLACVFVICVEMMYLHLADGVMGK